MAERMRTVERSMGEFRRFLRLQEGRNDPVGDFARDFLRDSRAERVRGIGWIGDFLEEVSACPEAVSTFHYVVLPEFAIWAESI